MTKRFSLLFAMLAAAALFAACGGDADEGGVRAHFSGTVTVRPEVDSMATSEGFELFVLAQNAEGDVDTLGQAVTAADGSFATNLRAEEKGLYPLLISRNGQVLVRTEMVVAEGDTTTLRLLLPLRTPLLPLRSQENAAWLAYRNTKAQYQQKALALAQQEGTSIADLEQPIGSTSAMLWGLGTTYPGTLGAGLAQAESILMLDGWNDSLLVARARALEASSPGYANVARTARRAVARREGQAAALALLDSMQSVAQGEAVPAIRSEVVVALSDSNATDRAIGAARAMQRDLAGTTWEDWAGRALYELQTLQPGMPAPAFDLATREGEPLSLSSLRGQPAVLEFYQPRDAGFVQNLAVRNALIESYRARGLPLRYVSISLEPDEAVNEALFERGEAGFLGTHVFEGGGTDGTVARLYNVNVLPTRYLLDAQGRIVGKYVGASLVPLQQDLIRMAQSPS